MYVCASLWYVCIRVDMCVHACMYNPVADTEACPQDEDKKRREAEVLKKREVSCRHACVYIYTHTGMHDMCVYIYTYRYVCICVYVY